MNYKTLQERLVETVLDAAKDQGAVYPVLGDVSNGTVCVVDTDSGKCYEVTVKAQKWAND